MRVMTVSTWTGAINSNWARPGNWSPGGAPDADTHVVIKTGAPVAAASIGTVDSIRVSADLSFESVDPSTVTTFLNNVVTCTSTTTRATAERSSTSGER